MIAIRNTPEVVSPDVFTPTNLYHRRTIPDLFYSARAAAATARATPTEPVIWCALPSKVAAGGDMPDMVGLDPLLLILLTIKDGHAVPSDMDGLLRVTVTSGAGPVGQFVPQAARTVDYTV